MINEMLDVLLTDLAQEDVYKKNKLIYFEG